MIIMGLLGVGFMLFGLLTFIGGSMSDAPAIGDDLGFKGCLMTVAGIVLLCVSIYLALAK